MSTGSGNAIQKRKVVPQMPGSWWCVHGSLRVDGAKVPQGPLLASTSPLKATVNIPGVKWLPEKRREISFMPPKPPPPAFPGVHPIFLANPTYKKALHPIALKTISNSQREIQQACKDARNLKGDPEDGRAYAMEYQKRYLETGNATVPGGALWADIETLKVNCEPGASPKKD